MAQLTPPVGFKLFVLQGMTGHCLDDDNRVPRSQPGAMIHGAEASLRHVMRMAEESALISINGKRIPVNPQSISVPGDTPMRWPLRRRSGMA